MRDDTMNHEIENYTSGVLLTCPRVSLENDRESRAIGRASCGVVATTHARTVFSLAQGQPRTEISTLTIALAAVT